MFPVGLGSHAQWDEKLDGRLAQALMSVQAVKAVEIGGGVAGGRLLRKRSAGRDFLRKIGATVPALDETAPEDWKVGSRTAKT